MIKIIDFIQSQHQVVVYSILLVLVFLENIIPLMPGDGFLILTAYLVGIGVLNRYLGFLVTLSGAALGFLLLYYLGKFHGREIITNRHPRLISPHKLQKIDYYFHRYGYKALAIGRFIPGTRFIIGVMAGFTKMNFSKSITYTIIAILVWNIFIFAIALYSTANWETIKLIVKKYNEFMLIAVISVILVVIIIRKKRSKDNG